MNSNKFIAKFFLTTIISLFSFINLFSQPVNELNAAQIKLALEKLNVLGSVLYVAAHPDDENTACLAYYSKGKLLRTGYLSLTRGDGGQNLIGKEQGAMIGLLRTQELLAARKIDGAEQFFSRAIDFGYSKSGKETMDIWGKKDILSDVVWVIRKFRPDVIITRFPGTGEGGHGNHTASQILAKEAFEIAGDSTAFPEQLKYVKPWQPKRIFWNAWLPILEKRHEDLSKLLTLDLGKYNPLLGKSYNEIAAESRSMHKSQGFGSTPNRGRDINYFEFTEGVPASKTLFDGIDLTWNRVKGSKKVSELLSEADNKFDPQNPSAIIPILLKAYSEMNKLHDDYWVPLKKKELAEVIRACAGIWIQALAKDYSAVPGQTIEVTAGVVNRSNFPFTLKEVKYTFQDKDSLINFSLKDENFASAKTTLTIPKDIPYSQPYWMVKPHLKGRYIVDNQRLIGKPMNPPPLTAKFIFNSYDGDFSLTIPVEYRWNDLVEGERYRPFIIVPDVAINIENKVYVFPDDSSKKVNITIISNVNNAKGTLRLDLPEGWKVDPKEMKFSIDKKNDQKTFAFEVTPPKFSSVGKIKASAEINGQIIHQGMVEINYSYIPIQTVFPPSESKLIRLNINKVVNNIGYIMGPGDDIPVSLKQLGYKVTLLSDKDLEDENLSRYDAIIAGIRAYNTRDKLPIYHKKLMDYVKNGGSFLVQYDVTRGLETKEIGPYPFEISHDRVTVEEAPVTFINKDNPLLNYPNKITEKDFDGWVQERGLYFAHTWDPKYQTVIECNDPGEDPLAGGLLYTKYGKGVFIYTGYSFFRQLPAGVPGAYRIFVNLFSSNKSETKESSSK